MWFYLFVVPLRVELAKPVLNPMYQDNPPPPPSFREVRLFVDLYAWTWKQVLSAYTFWICVVYKYIPYGLIRFLYFCQAMESCPKADIENLKDLLVEENLYLYTEVLFVCLSLCICF